MRGPSIVGFGSYRYPLASGKLGESCATGFAVRGKELVVDRADLVVQAVRRFSSGGADFADCLIEATASAAGCRTTMTFDAGAVKAAGMTLVS
jgi:predicted nucleic-acid-binding protein